MKEQEETRLVLNPEKNKVYTEYKVPPIEYNRYVFAVDYIKPKDSKKPLLGKIKPLSFQKFTDDGYQQIEESIFDIKSIKDEMKRYFNSFEFILNKVNKVPSVYFIDSSIYKKMVMDSKKFNIQNTDAFIGELIDYSFEEGYEKAKKSALLNLFFDNKIPKKVIEKEYPELAKEINLIEKK